MIATLPMYDWPEERGRIDALWARLRDSLRDHGLPAPEALTRSDDLHGLWRHPDLLLGQACGLPYSLDLHDKTHLVGALDPALPGLPQGQYQSVLIARADDRRAPAALLAGTVAVNAADSQSGWGALAHWAETQRLEICGRIKITGAHLGSAEAVVAGRADIAALDVVTWGLVARHRASLAAALREVGRTPPTPALPLLTTRRFDPETIGRAIDAALGPRALIRFRTDDYLGVPRVPFPRAEAV